MYQAPPIARVVTVSLDRLAEFAALVLDMGCRLDVSAHGVAWVHGPRADEVVAEWGKRGN